MEERKARIAILLSGRGSNMEALARSARSGVLAPRCEVVGVFSDRAVAPGLALARDLGLSTACLEVGGRDREAYDAEVAALLSAWRPDWIALAGYLRILSPPFVRRFGGRIVNVHPADTGEHRGLGGYRWAFERGLQETKVTVHLVDEGLDTGPIVAQRPVDLRGAASLEEVEHRGLAVEHALYPEALAELIAGRPLPPAPSPTSGEGEGQAQAGTALQEGRARGSESPLPRLSGKGPGDGDGGQGRAG